MIRLNLFGDMKQQTLYYGRLDTSLNYLRQLQYAISL